MEVSPDFRLLTLADADAAARGLSSKLVRPILAMADARQAIVYTDTEKRANVPLYEHFGFQVVEEAKVERTRVTVWALRRSVQ